MTTMKEYTIKDVELEITNFCEHRCPYCYLGDANCYQKPYYSDFETVCRVIDKLNEYGVETIALLGGDPVMHPRIIDIIRYIKSTTSIKVSIMSNTLDFGDSDFLELATIIDNIDFTLHGRNAAEHEKYCHGKQGLYNDVMQKLKNYIRLGVNVNIAINITPYTFDKVFEMAKSVQDNGVFFNTLLIQRILPLGRAKNSREYDVKRNQIAEALRQIENAETVLGINISFEDPFPLCYVDEKYHKYMKGCPEGVSRLPVRGDGLVSSCGASGDRVLGNILIDSYEKIWLNNQRFIEFRTASFLKNKKCLNCRYKNACRGGCPVRYMMSENEGEEFWEKFENE